MTRRWSSWPQIFFKQECAGQVLFREKAQGLNAYIVCKGDIGLFARSEEAPPTPKRSNDLTKQLTMTDAVQKGVYRPKAGTHIMATAYKTTEGNTYFSEDSTLGDLVREVRPGASALFGESILRSTEVRDVSAKCLADTELLVIPRAAFWHVRAASMLSHSRLCKSMSVDVISHLAKKARIYHECSGQVVFRQGDHTIRTYVVARGKVGMFVRDSQTARNTPRASKHGRSTPSSGGGYM